MSVLPADGRPVLGAIVDDMLSALRTRGNPPDSPAGLPDPDLALVEMKERPVGLGNLRGNATFGPLGAVSLKGLRLDALVRFELWASSAGDVNAAGTTVRTNLFASLDDLRGDGFLKFAAADSTAAEQFPSGLFGSPAWRKTVSYKVLYEHPYEDTSGTTGLITRIPVTSETDASVPEPHLVTGPAVRWDNETAPLWRLRGPARFTRLFAMVYFPGDPPAGQVTVRRTFDGATGPPAEHASLDALLTAVDPAGAAERHAQVTFQRLAAVPGPPPDEALLHDFTATGDEVTLGNWERALDPLDPDEAADAYVISARELAPAVVLPGPADRLEISFEHPSFPLPPIAALYLKF